jgi:hypothetical protein
MTVAEIFDRGARSPLLHDPFVQRIWDMVQDDQLFKKSPEQLEEIKRVNRRESLSFFARHSPYYAALFDRLDIDPKSASIDDLAKLAVPSDLLRGDGQRPFLIDDVEPVAQGKVYFITDERAYSYEELYGIMAEILGKPRPRCHLPVLLAKLMVAPVQGLDTLRGKRNFIWRIRTMGTFKVDRHYSINRVQMDLGYRPTYDLAIGLRETVQW